MQGLSRIVAVVGLTAALASTREFASPALPFQDTDVSMVAIVGEGARYWPRWRGPSGQGFASGTSYPDKWSATENVLWKVRVPGEGNSSPIVWGDRIFLTTAHEGGRPIVSARIPPL
jgi:hypothetical protein